MAIEDAKRWNKKYQNNKIPDEPIKLLQEYAHKAPGKDALDIACGMGRHSKYLASLGFMVDALDISSVAIASLKGLKNIEAKEVDFDVYKLKENSYDLIVCVYFLKRSLFEQMINALKPNGILIMETFVEDQENEREPSNPDFLLKKGELEKVFSKRCQILHSREYISSDYRGFKSKKAQLVAKLV
jgi:2-polyprenyl-3-methyl-5-hydroxy-6-metoxy-1,4-benzoquinol methylase